MTHIQTEIHRLATLWQVAFVFVPKTKSSELLPRCVDLLEIQGRGHTPLHPTPWPGLLRFFWQTLIDRQVYVFNTFWNLINSLGNSFLLIFLNLCFVHLFRRAQFKCGVDFISIIIFNSKLNSLYGLSPTSKKTSHAHPRTRTQRHTLDKLYSGPQSFLCVQRVDWTSDHYQRQCFFFFQSPKKAKEEVFSVVVLKTFFGRESGKGSCVFEFFKL